MDFPCLYKEDKLLGWRNLSKISGKKGITISRYHGPWTEDCSNSSRKCSKWQHSAPEYFQLQVSFFHQDGKIEFLPNFSHYLNFFSGNFFRSYKQDQRGDYCVPTPEWGLLRALSLNCKDINKAYVFHWKSNISFSLHPKGCSDSWNTINVTKRCLSHSMAAVQKTQLLGRPNKELNKVYHFRKPSLFWRLWSCQLKDNSTCKHNLADRRINFLWAMLSLGQCRHTTVNLRNIPFTEMSG